MKKPLDVFSAQSDGYKKFRPTYPLALYDAILSHVESTDCCWDCGTGNGQVAVSLAPHFRRVYATDISEAQLALAEKKDAITYRVERGEKTTFDENTFDLITVAQALHWFDFDAFYREVVRVSKNGAVIAIWGYGLLRITEPLNRQIDRFYSEVIGPYWNAERKHIDSAYESIPFPFTEIPTPSKHVIRIEWDLAHLEGYFNSWSSVQHYRRQHSGRDPLKAFMSKLQNVWGPEEKKSVCFPIFMKMGRVFK